MTYLELERTTDNIHFLALYVNPSDINDIIVNEKGQECIQIKYSKRIEDKLKELQHYESTKFQKHV